MPFFVHFGGKKGRMDMAKLVITMASWAANYWWHDPSIFNSRVREFFKVHK